MLKTIKNPKTSSSITDKERNDFVKRIKLACRRKGTTLAYLNMKIGKSSGYLRNMGFISPKIAPLVKEVFPDLNIDYINSGEGEMFLENDNKINNCEIPLLPMRAQGGTLTTFETNKQEYKYETIVVPVADASLAIRIQDDSMSPYLIPGSIVVLQKIDENAFIEWGKTFVLDTRNGVLVRNVLPCSEDEKKVICSCENSHYDRIFVPMDAVFGWYRILLQIR